MSNSEGAGPPVVRDRGRFSRLYPDSRAVIPPDAAGEIEFKPTCVLIREREERLLAEERARGGKARAGMVR